MGRTLAYAGQEPNTIDVGRVKMSAKPKRPETIENRWDILYRKYPEAYEEFSKVPRIPALDLATVFRVDGKVVVDVGAGTGNSTLPLATRAMKVIGVDPEESMLKIARRKLKQSGLKNVVFRKGTSDNMPVPDQSVDLVVAVTAAGMDVQQIQAFVKEAERVLVPGGSIMSLDIAPGWYGGDLAPIITNKSAYFRRKIARLEHDHSDTFAALGFKRRFFYQTQRFDSREHIISTYGFIFGKKAIEYLKANDKTTIKWKYVVHYKQV